MPKISRSFSAAPAKRSSSLSGMSAPEHFNSCVRVVAVMSSDANENPWDPRHILCGGGALVFSAMMASLLGASKPVRAETLTGSVPEVDRLSIRVVVDSYQFAVAAGKKAGPLDIQHFGWGLSSVKPPDRTLVSEFGLSMHAESNRGSETCHLLMDFGFTPEALSTISICWPLTQPTWIPSRSCSAERDLRKNPIVLLAIFLEPDTAESSITLH